MADITLEKAQEALNAWVDASIKVATLGQMYEIEIDGSRRKVDHGNIEFINAQIKYWQSEVNRLSGTSRVGQAVLG